MAFVSQTEIQFGALRIPRQFTFVMDAANRGAHTIIAAVVEIVHRTKENPRAKVAEAKVRTRSREKVGGASEGTTPRICQKGAICPKVQMKLWAPKSLG